MHFLLQVVIQRVEEKTSTGNLCWEAQTVKVTLFPAGTSFLGYVYKAQEKVPFL